MSAVPVSSYASHYFKVSGLHEGIRVMLHHSRHSNAHARGDLPLGANFAGAEAFCKHCSSCILTSSMLSAAQS